MQIIRTDTMSDTDFVWTEQANAPKSGEVVCAWTDLPDRTLHEVHFGGSEEAFQLLLFRNRDALHGYVNKCPHHWLTMNRRSDGEFMMCANVTDFEKMGAFMSNPERMQWDTDNGAVYKSYTLSEMDG